MLKALVFDFDGVIVDSEPLHHRAFLRVARTFGVSFDYQEYVDKYIGFDDRDAFRAMQGLPTGAPGSADQEKRLAELIEQKAHAFEDVVNEGVSGIPGVEALIRDAAKVMPVSVASGASRRDIDLVLGRLGLRDLFGVIVSADDVARSKPDPQTYALAVEHLAQRHPDLAVRPGDCLAIEDTAAGVESARGAGLQTLALLTSTPATRLSRAHRIMPAPGGPTLAQVRAWFG